MTIRTGIAVQEVTQHAVILADSSRYPTNLTVWSTGNDNVIIKILTYLKAQGLSIYRCLFSSSNSIGTWLNLSYLALKFHS